MPPLYLINEGLAGGTAFAAVLNFRVAHMPRCVTGGVFDFDLLIENCMSASRTLPSAGGSAFETVLNFRVADPSWVSRGRWV